MADVRLHPNHISQVLGQMVKKWEHSLPEGVRELEKFNRENNNVLLKTGEEKDILLRSIKLKNFKCPSTGQRLDLTAYKDAIIK